MPKVTRVVLASPSDGIDFIDGLKSAYGIDTSSFKSLQKVDYSIGFASVASGSAQMCVGYTTDGSIAAQNFIFLAGRQERVPAVSPRARRAHGCAQEISGHRHDPEPARSQVDDGGEHPAAGSGGQAEVERDSVTEAVKQVAKEFLQKAGLLPSS